MNKLNYNKIIDIADFGHAALLPFLEQIAYDEMIRFGLDKPELIPDSKQWECAMMLRAFSDHNLILPGKLFAGIGAGTEQTTFALASRGCITFPTDRYLEVTPWSDVAPATMMVRPQQYSHFSFERGTVIPVHSDARSANLPSGFFDGVYSAGSIEHFGSLDSVAAAAEEIGRILKPGGIASLSTEFRLEGPNDRRWFDDNCILFTPSIIEEYIIKPSGLRLADDLITDTSAATFNSQVVLLDFLSKAVKVRTVQDKRDAYPNLVLFHEGFLFCSVHLTLVKPEGIGAIKIGNHSEIFAERVNDEALAASGVLTQQINLWRESFGRDSDPQRALAERVHQLEAELHAVQVKFREATEHNHSNEGRLLDILNTGSISAVDFDETVQFIENFRVDRLHHLVGNFRDHELHSDGASGFLCFGPYATLDIGHYRVEFELYARGDAEGYVSADVCVDQGTNILTKRDLRASELIENLHLEFSLDIPSTDIEFRIAVSGAVDFVFRGARLVQRRIT